MPEAIPTIVCKPVLSETKGWFEKARPKVSTKDFTTQVGVHFEEVGEMIAEISTEDLEVREALVDAKIAIVHLSDLIKRKGGIFIETEDNVDFLDSIVDQLVTATGVAHTCGYDVIGALDAVNTQNFSKFDPETGKPLYDENMKVIKGPAYQKANLTPFVG